MKLTLRRLDAQKHGVFGELVDADGLRIAVTLEHAYLQPGGGYRAKVAPGEYVCLRGEHRLRPDDGNPATHDDDRFDTFEVMGVPPFQGAAVKGILFHVGNFQRNSRGCVLLGQRFAVLPSGEKIITQSLSTFNQFMARLAGARSFVLEVTASPPPA